MGIESNNVAFKYCVLVHDTYAYTYSNYVIRNPIIGCYMRDKYTKLSFEYWLLHFCLASSIFFENN